MIPAELGEFHIGSMKPIVYSSTWPGVDVPNNLTISFPNARCRNIQPIEEQKRTRPNWMLIFTKLDECLGCHYVYTFTTRKCKRHTHKMSGSTYLIASQLHLQQRPGLGTNPKHEASRTGCSLGQNPVSGSKHWHCTWTSQILESQRL